VQGFPFPFFPSGVAWGNAHYVVVGDDSIYASADGSTWNKVTGDETAGIEFERVRWGNGRFVAVGSYTPQPPVFGQLPLGIIFTSPDGEHWTSAGDLSDVTVLGDRVHDVIWGGGQFVAVGSSTGSLGGLAPTPIFTSANGVDWTRRTVNEFPGPSLRASPGSAITSPSHARLRLRPEERRDLRRWHHWSYVSFPTSRSSRPPSTASWTGKYLSRSATSAPKSYRRMDRHGRADT
jgi:hypothetical protein